VVLLSGCSHTAPVGPRIDPALEGFIPADTTLMAGFRLERIEKTDVYKKYLANRTLPQIQEFAARTGIDPQKNLWELLYLSNGKRSVLLGHGMFSDEGEPDLAKHGDSRFSYGGFNLVGNDQSAILLVNQTVMAVGDTGELKAMVDAHEKPPGPPPAMTALLARMPESAQIWAADAGGTDLHLPIDASGLLANVTKILEHVQSGTIYFDLTSGLNGLAESTSPSAQEAEQLASGLRALIGFGRLSVPANQPELQSVFDGLRPTREDREVKLHVEEPPELVDKLIGMLEGKAAGQPSGLVPR
jgi:hypothetical protein